jgi:ribonucleoside-diphosphate reductase alpha chain
MSLSESTIIPVPQEGRANPRSVRKRSGALEPIAFDKITERLAKLHRQEPALADDVEYIEVAQKTIQGVYHGVTTVELDNLAAETAAAMASKHPGYDQLAARIAVSNLHKQTESDYRKVVLRLLSCVAPGTAKPAPLVSGEFAEFVSQHCEQIQAWFDYERDYDYDYFGFRTLERSYLLKDAAGIIERPQHMLMRVAIGIHMKAQGANYLEMIRKTYDYMSKKWFTHATPTLCNAGTRFPQMSSCFLTTVKDDSIEGIYETIKQTAIISKHSGGIGVSVHNVRAANSYIAGSGGTSNGIVPMLRVLNDTARYVDQGGNKRKGAIAVYLEPWHADVFEFLQLKKPQGKEEFRARDLFYAMWIPDLFMKRVRENGQWSLFCPNDATGLCDRWGVAFENKYTELEAQGLARKVVKAQDLWHAIIESQIETGTPYLMFKDACNRKSNQQNLGTIRSSNLCTEIVQYSSSDEIAVCNLASVCLSKCVDEQFIGKLSWAAGPVREAHFGLNIPRLYECVKQLVINLNAIIDSSFYPLPETKRSNERHRPIGIGVQGLADFFHILRIPFASERAKQLNQFIFEVIYYAALCASNELAVKYGPYSTFEGSPASKGLLQPDLWNDKTTTVAILSDGIFNWGGIRQKIKEHGLRNSLLVAPMPTATTAQILGNNEGFEPYTSNIFARRTLAGEFTVLNTHLIKELVELNLWTAEIRNAIIYNRGSVQDIAEIPFEVRERYKTVWELKMVDLIDMAADRGAFIDQSQSFSCFVAQPTVTKLTSMHFYAWRKGLKTGMYYLRTLPASQATQITVTKTAVKTLKTQAQPTQAQTQQRSQQRGGGGGGATAAAASAVSELGQTTQATVPPAGASNDDTGNVDGEICRMEEGCIVCGS